VSSKTVVAVYNKTANGVLWDGSLIPSGRNFGEQVAIMDGVILVSANDEILVFRRNTTGWYRSYKLQVWGFSTFSLGKDTMAFSVHSTDDQVQIYRYSNYQWIKANSIPVTKSSRSSPIVAYL